MKKLLLVLPIVALSLFALPAVSHAQNLNTGNTDGASSAPAESPAQGGGSESEQGD